MCHFLFCTAPSVTYDHPTVLLLWQATWTIAAGMLTLLLAWGGITLIMREHLNPRWATWRELMPRLMIATLAASSSLWWGSMAIDLNNAVIDYFRSAVLVDSDYLIFWNIGIWSDLLSDQPWETLALYVALLVAMAFYGLTFVVLMIQLVIRLALIDTLLVLSPVGLVLWVLPQTGSWATWWLRAFLVTVFQQAVQVVVLTLGTLFLLDAPESQSVSQVLLQLPVAMAVVYLATRVPSILERVSGVSVSAGWLQTMGLAFLAWRTVRALPDLGISRLVSHLRTPAAGGGNGGTTLTVGGPPSSPSGGPRPMAGPAIQGQLSAPRATQLAASRRLALPPGSGSGAGALSNDSRFPRMLLDSSRSVQQREDGGEA